jgi:hypothetical protein
MSIDFDCFCFTVLFMIPSAVLLSVCIGVAGCGWFNSSNVIRIGTASFAFIYNPPHSASAADCITDLIIFANI